LRGQSIWSGKVKGILGKFFQFRIRLGFLWVNHGDRFFIQHKYTHMVVIYSYKSLSLYALYRRNSADLTEIIVGKLNIDALLPPFKAERKVRCRRESSISSDFLSTGGFSFRLAKISHFLSCYRAKG